MNNLLQIDSNLLSCCVVYTPLRGETEEGIARACWLNSNGNLVFLLELYDGCFVERLASCCKKIFNER